MTPKGRVIGLPNGSTPIDFAYRIHTDVGHTCVGALVNDAMVPLNTELHTGDVVNIRTMKGTGPSEDWLKFVKTSQAKNKIKAWFARRESEKKESMVPQGEKVLSDELHKRGFEPKDYMEKKKIEAILKEFSCKDYSDLMYGLAAKLINPTAVCEKLTNQKRSLNDEEALTKLLNRDTPKKHPVQTKTGIVVPGIESMKLSLAQCCLPVYGDKIIGYVTKGEGVKVHRADCVNVAGQTARLIECYWDKEDNERQYDTDLVIISEDRNFLLTDIVNTVSQSRAPMIKVSANLNREDLTTVIKLKIQVKTLDQLEVLLANIRKVDGVISAVRVSH
jgi:GTP pyrophosphokinase